MKKQHNIPFRAFLLFLVYLLSISPSILFHQHKSSIASSVSATCCEKAVYFSGQDGNYSHQTHLAKTTEKCWLCDNHTVSHHSLQAISIEYFSKEFIRRYFEISPKYYFQSSYSFSNRGPPSVSSPAI